MTIEKKHDGPKVDAVFGAIAKVQEALAKAGIGKDRSNQQQNYKFRGIDDVYNALAPLLAQHGLCILPRVLSREVTERATKSGGALFYVVVEVEYDFVSVEDGSRHTITVYGEAMDSGDKATNKAMSAAYKYACLQTFCIPTEGGDDPDQTTHSDIKTTAASVLGSPEELKSFVMRTTAAIQGAATQSLLSNIKTAHQKTFDLLKGSTNADDGKAIQELTELFRTRWSQLGEAASKGQEQTVESAMAKAKGAVLDDEIPF